MTRMGLRFMPPTQLLLHMKLYRMVVNSVPTCPWRRQGKGLVLVSMQGPPSKERTCSCRLWPWFWVGIRTLQYGSRSSTHLYTQPPLLCTYPSFSPLIHLPSTKPSIHLHACLHIHPSAYTPVYTPMYPSTPLSCRSTSHPFTHSSTHLLTCLPI